MNLQMDTPVFLLLVVLTTTLVQVQCSGTCSTQYPVIPGAPGRDGILEQRVKREIKVMMVVMAMMAYKEFPVQMDQKVNQEVPHLTKKT